MRKKVLGIVLVIILLLQAVQFGSVFASSDMFALNIEDIAKRGNVLRGYLEYGEFDSQKVLIVKPGFTTRQSSTTTVLDYVLPDRPDVTEYRFAVIEYYKTDNDTTMKFRPSLNGKMKYITFDGTSDKWHRGVWEMIPDGSDTTLLHQFNFFPFGDQDANSISDEVCYIKSIEFYKENPLTEEEIAFNKQIVEEIAKNYESLRGVDEELAIFEDLDKLDKTSELLQDASFENESSIWTGSDASVSVVSGGAYGGEKYAKVSERTGQYSGMQQDIKDVLNKYGPGDYRVSAFIKNDTGAESTYKDYKLAVFLNGKEIACSTFHITDSWQKINGAFRLNWNGNLNSATIKISSVNKDDLADFYVDSVSMVKCLYNEVETTHTAYMKGNADGSFSPEGNITRAETCAIVSRLMADEASFKGVYLSNYPDITISDWYYDNVAYLESLGLLTYFNGDFNPNAAISRAEFVNIAKNISTLSGSNNVSFADVDELHPLYNDIVSAAKTGLVAGYEDGTFHPDSTITRAEAATIINRATGRHIVTASYYGAKTTPFTDVDESHWAYGQIVEASTNHDATIIDKGDRLIEAWKITAENYDTELAKKIEADAISKGDALKEEILNAKDNLEIAGTKYYVSNSGNDSNSGLSPNEAWASIDKINSFKFKEGDAVLFERGGLWRGATVLCQNGLTYAAYGAGEKPKLYGSDRNYADPSFWTETEIPNVWITAEKFSNVGFIQFDNGKHMSQKVYSEAEVNKNFHFIQDKYSGAPLRLYYDGGNPGSAFENIEIAPEYSIFIADNKHDIRIDNITMKYTGWHGVKFANVENVSVTNCEVGWIGGAGGSPTGSQTRWGNGIEFWQNCNNILVDHCYVYQVYDTAITNQWKGETGGVVREENITYTNNLVDYCTYAFEFFMRQPNSNSTIMKNVRIADNITRYTAYGWGQDNRPNKDTSADIKGWSSHNRTENFVIENNIFVGAKLVNVNFSSYSINIPAKTSSYKNKMPQHLVKLNGNTYINNIGKTFADYNFEKYTTAYDSNYQFIKDNVDLNAKLILTDSKYEPAIKVETSAPASSLPSTTSQPTSENLIANSDCDNIELWTKNKGAKGKITVESEGDNKYLSLSDRAGSYERLEFGNIAAKLNEYGAGTYQLTGKIKVDGALGATAGEVYILASSYRGQYERYNMYSKINDVTNNWKEFSVTLDTSSLEFTTWPEDTVVAIGEHSGAFDEAAKLCIDDIKLYPVNTKPVATSGSSSSSASTSTSLATASSGKTGETSNVTKEENAKNILKNGNMDLDATWTLAAGAPKAVALAFEKEDNGNKYIKMSGRTADWIGFEQLDIGSKFTSGNTYIFKAIAKIEGDAAAAGAVEIYLTSKTNKEFKIYKKFANIGDAWKNIEFEFTLNDIPSDAKLNIRGVTTKIDNGNTASYNICFDDITIIEK